jgi:hypothetical protein
MGVAAGDTVVIVIGARRVVELNGAFEAKLAGPGYSAVLRPSLPSSGDRIVSAKTSTLIGAETGIKTIAAVHSKCRLKSPR